MPPVNIFLRANNDQYVGAEGGGGREIYARATIPREWETFTLIDPDGSPLKSGDRVVLATYIGKYVCAEGAGGEELNATRDIAREWETFKILNVDGSGGEIIDGQKVALQSFDGRHYWQAEGGGGGLVNCVGPWTREWETFTIQILGSPPLRVAQGPDRLTNGEWMESTVIFSDSGRVDTEVHTWTNMKMYGFTGGMVAFFYDINHNVIANTPMRSYGVNGVWIPGAPSSRNDLQIDNVGQDVFNKTVGIRIIHKLNPHNRLLEDINRGIAIGKDIAEVIKIFL